MWMIDDGPFGLLAAEHDATWAFPHGTLVAAREVADGTKSDKSGRRQLLLSHPVPSPCVGIHDGGTAANAMLWGHIRPVAARATRDLGEDASVAICATELTTAVFVTMDKRAAYVALAELGTGRVATPFDLWDDLERTGHISIEKFRRLCDRTAKLDQGLSSVPMRHQR